ncbi:MAG TPA: rod shape-determining protein [Actinoplanes sp.]|nr:rod shape-determining protein [Actinoplanes sp.]
MPADLAPARTSAGQRPDRGPVPAALAVDLGSGVAGMWAAHQGTVTVSCGDGYVAADALMRRGRVVDVDGCVVLLQHLVAQYPQPVPTGGVVVACQPVLATEADRTVTRRVLDAVFAPARLHFIDTVRAAAIGSGAAAGTLLVTDVGAQLTEVALLRNGRVIAARRSDVGTRDLAHGATVDLVSGNAARHLHDLRTDPAAADLPTATARGMLLVGDGATRPDLALALSRSLRLRVHRAADPRTTALNGAGLAAMSLLRHPAIA